MSNTTSPPRLLAHKIARSSLGKALRLASRVTAKYAFSPLRACGPVRRKLRLPGTHLVGFPKNGRGAKGTFVPLDPPVREIWLRPQMLPDQPVPKLYSADAEIETEATGVLVLQRARFWGHYAGVVIDANDSLVAPVSRDVWGASRHTAFTRPSLPAITRLPGRTLSLATPEADGNFHHWLIDLLPRIELVKRAGFALESFDRIIVNHRDLPFQLETLVAAGIDLSKVLRSSANVHVLCDELVVPTIVADNTKISRRASQATRAVTARAKLPRKSSLASTSPKRVYLSRGDASFRRVLNEDEVIEALRSHDFTPVQMSRLTVAEQHALIRGADVIAGPAGANLASTVFAHAGAQVLEILPSGWVHPYNWGIAASVDAAFFALINGRAPESTELTIEQRFRDFTVDLPALHEMVDFMFSSPTLPHRAAAPLYV